MDAIQEFWTSPGLFPPDFGGFRFLGKGVNELGKAKFGTDWTGQEARAPRLLVPSQSVGGIGGIPSAEIATPNQRLDIDLLLQKHRPDFKRPYPERGPFGPVVAQFATGQWDEGIRLALESDRKSLAARQRFSVVVATLIEALREDRMKSAVRPIRGGDFSAFLPPSVWNSEQIGNRFSLCQMNPLKPFDIGIAGDGYQLIFVDVEGLETLVARASPTARTTTPVWQKIIELKKNDPTLAKEAIAKHFPKLGGREFNRHWDKARENYPPLSKAGRPSRQSEAP
jgi:hypothetical protein